jgi:hypothetical protein
VASKKKAQGRRPEPKTSRLPVIAALALVIAVGAFVLLRPRSAPPASQVSPGAAASVPSPAGDVASVPEPVPDGPGSNDPFIAPDLPPIPLHVGPPSRPVPILKAVYEFAARRPDVLSRVPCFCGCEHDGHQANDDCFVAARDAEGRVVSWDGHGVT